MLTPETIIDHVLCEKCKGSGYRKSTSLIIKNTQTKDFTVFFGLGAAEAEEWMIDQSQYSTEESEVLLECTKCNGRGEVLSFDSVFAGNNDSRKNGKAATGTREFESSNCLSLSPFQKTQPGTDIYTTDSDSSYDYWKLRELENQKKSFDKKCHKDNTARHYRRRNFLRYAKTHSISITDDQITQYLKNSLSPKKWLLAEGII
jgi:hypothetical protein